MRALMLVLALVQLGCVSRTHLRTGTAEAKARGRGPEIPCGVMEYSTGGDLPAGAINLGWVQVPRTDSDAATAESLRNKVCEMGGDAITQVAWIREAGVEGMVLKANAWQLP